MTEYKRFGLYVVPEGPLFAAGSAWLGWNSATGREEPQQVVPGLVAQADALTRTPRKYGFHGTLKPPFRLADGMYQAALGAAARAFCATRRPVVIPALTLRRLGGFVAITPEHPSEQLNDLACATVATLDPFRAAPSDAELSRRRKSGLSTRQDALLRTWGYPYVMEEFRFHMTLTGRCDNPDTVRDALEAHFAPVLPAPFVIDSLCLMGEAQDGLFHLIHRYRFSQ